MKIRFDDALPISARRDDIAEAIANHQVVVIAGETGSGKTTQLPKILHQLGRQSIVHTQPRRIAAKSVAERIAAECEVELGREVGYAVRFDDSTSADTQIAVMTDGLLLSSLHHDPDLRRWDTIIIDEAHERSLAIDFLLGYCVKLLARRPDLKLVITSATIDVESFARLFDAPMIEVSGRTYPVDIRYRPLDEETDQIGGIEAALRELPRDGDVLVFLSGEREIRDALEHLEGRKLPHTEILPLYGRLSLQQQQRIFRTGGKRRIILSTNVAETSLTVPGIRYVIDTGLARISRYSTRHKVQRLPIEAISQASAQQRAGRCGRLGPGICIRLYSKDDHDERPEFTDPEIRRTNLAAVLLTMALLELGPIEDFEFLDPPDSKAVRDGQLLLAELGALADGRLTKLGRTMASLPVDPRLARMLMAAEELGCLADMLIIVSGLSIQDPRERPADAEAQADQLHKRFASPTSDFLSFLSLWRYLGKQRKELSGNQFRAMCRREHLHYLRIREWQDVHAQLRRVAKDAGLKPGSVEASDDQIAQALLPGLLSQVGMKDPEKNHYKGARGSSFVIFPGSSLAKKPPAWIVAAELVETSRLFARTVSAIDPAWIEPAAQHLTTTSWSDPVWSKRRGQATALERVTLFGLPIVTGRRVALAKHDKPLARELFIRHCLVEGQWRTHHRFWHDNQQLLAELADEEHRMRSKTIRPDDEMLIAFYDERLPESIVSVRHFDSWWKRISRKKPDLLRMSRNDFLLAGSAEDFPREWTSQSNDYALEYLFDPADLRDGVTVTLSVTELMSADAAEFSWHVPGHRLDLVTEWLRTLPKQKRRAFVPARDVAARFLAEVGERPAGDLVEQLAIWLTNTAQTPVNNEDFDVAKLPTHLRLKFRILDEDGNEIGLGHDIAELRQRLKPALQEQVAETVDFTERHGLKAFEPTQIEPHLHGGAVTFYPTFVDQGESISLVLADSQPEQHVAMRRALARLASWTLPSPKRWFNERLSMPDKLLLTSAPYKNLDAIVEDCWLAAIEELIEPALPLWTADDFSVARDQIAPKVWELTEKKVATTTAIMRQLANITLGDDEASQDVQVQLSWLIYPGFIRDSHTALARLPIYLQAAARRLATTKDLAEVYRLEARFHELTEGLSELRRLGADIAAVRWGLEELRVSIVAQNLKADRPVSVTRADRWLDELAAGLSQRRSGQ